MKIARDVVCVPFISYMSSIWLQCLSSMSTSFPADRLTIICIEREINGNIEKSIPIEKSHANRKDCIYWFVCVWEREGEKLLRVWCSVINFSKFNWFHYFLHFLSFSELKYSWTLKYLTNYEYIHDWYESFHCISQTRNKIFNFSRL